MLTRRLAALPLAALAAAVVAGCEVEVAPGAIPAPISLRPTPSESAGVPKFVCSQTYKILTEGAVRVASDTQSAAAVFTDMATQVDAEVSRTTEPGLRSALQAISDDLRAGAQQPDPKTYIDGGFRTVGQKLDGHCD